jgi:pimeloyl-ACP methyl ester carboxylesterase
MMFLEVSLIIVLGIVILYLFFSLLMFLFQERLLFFRQPLNLENAALLKDMACHFQGEKPEIQLHGWCKIIPKQPIVLYFGGNGEEVSFGFLQHSQQHWPLSLVFINYRGYGESTGKPSEIGLKKDALAIYDAIKQDFPDVPIYLIGRSLGTAIALYLAAYRPVHKLLLITPFDSVASIAKKRYPYLLIDFLLKHPFRTLTDAAKVKAPTYVFLAEEETITPYDNSLTLVKALPNCQKVLFVLGSDHHSIASIPSYFQEVAKIFLEG